MTGNRSIHKEDGQSKTRKEGKLILFTWLVEKRTKGFLASDYVEWTIEGEE